MRSQPGRSEAEDSLDRGPGVLRCFHPGSAVRSVRVPAKGAQINGGASCASSASPRRGSNACCAARKSVRGKCRCAAATPRRRQLRWHPFVTRFTFHKGRTLRRQLRNGLARGLTTGSNGPGGIKCKSRHL
jgi:hypothetical protein